MKAAFYNGHGIMEVKDYPTPKVGPGEVMIRVMATGICGSELNMYKSLTKADEVPA